MIYTLGGQGPRSVEKRAEKEEIGALRLHPSQGQGQTTSLGNPGVHRHGRDRADAHDHATVRFIPRSVEGLSGNGSGSKLGSIKGKPQLWLGENLKAPPPVRAPTPYAGNRPKTSSRVPRRPQPATQGRHRVEEIELRITAGYGRATATDPDVARPCTRLRRAYARFNQRYISMLCTSTVSRTLTPQTQTWITSPVWTTASACSLSMLHLMGGGVTIWQVIMKKTVRHQKPEPPPEQKDENKSPGEPSSAIVTLGVVFFQ